MAFFLPVLIIVTSSAILVAMLYKVSQKHRKAGPFCKMKHMLQV
jgi:hypothetical protein